MFTPLPAIDLRTSVPALATRLLLLLVLAMGCSMGGAHAAPKDEGSAITHPILRVPRLGTAPKIDGHVDPAEWAGAAQVTGFAAPAGVGPYTMVPEIQQIQWYIGYDETWLYLAMHSPHKKGTYPAARVKEDDNNMVLFEDHVEIQITPYARADAARPGKGFYKMMVNPKDAMIDQHFHNGTIGTEEMWSTGGPRKSEVTEDHWDLEMQIELKRLNVKALDGRSLIMQLVRTDSCTGVYFAGWSPSTWMAWDEFASVDFDPQAPTFQFRRIGEVMEGNLDTEIALTGNGPKPVEVTVEVSVDAGDGKRVYHQKQTATAEAGTTAMLRFTQADIPVTSGEPQTKRNWFEIKATYLDRGKTVTLYQNRSPFIRLDAGFREKYLDPWLAGRPQSGEWEYRIAYRPYDGVAEVGVDVDFFGIPAPVLAAAKFGVTVRDAAGKVLASVDAPIAETKGQAMLKLPELPAGAYTARFTLYSNTGAVVAEKDAAFKREHFDWEHNTLGLDDEVILPYLPFRTRGEGPGMTLRTVMAELTMAPGGLPATIIQLPPTGNGGNPRESLLASPIRLEARAGGAELKATDATVQVAVAESLSHVDVTGSQRFGAVDASIKGTLDYDNWYQIDLTLTPAAGVAGEAATTLDSLDLVADLRDLPVDTLYVQRLGDGRYGNHYGGIPKAPGVAFRSTDLLRYKDGYGKDWGSFVPRTFVGNGDRGLWFFAWDDTGWQQQADQPVVQIERLANGTARLRVRLLAGPVTLEAPRHLTFALQPTPAKPNHARYRTAIAEGAMLHDTTGYRYYGDSVDAFNLPTDEDYRALRRFLQYGPRGQNEESTKRYGWYTGRTTAMAENPAVVLYGSTWMTGVGAPEFRTYGGSWLGKSNWEPRVDQHYYKVWNYAGTIQWDTPEEITPTVVKWPASFVDFFVYHHNKLIGISGINGTWWDNSSIGVIQDYDPATGTLVNRFNTLMRRNLTKRLNVVGWQNARAPMWAMNMHTDFSFSQVFWMVENDWYCSAPDQTAFEHFGLDEFRAMARTKSTMLIAKPWLAGFTGTTPEMDRKVKRSVQAITLAHDIVLPPHYKWEPWQLQIQQSLEGCVGLADVRACLFTGYWRTDRMVQPADPGIKVSVYANAAQKRAVLFAFNPTRKDLYVGGTTFDLQALLGTATRPTLRRCYDLETGEALQVTVEGGRLKLLSPVELPWSEFRMIGIEAE